MLSPSSGSPLSSDSSSSAINQCSSNGVFYAHVLYNYCIINIFNDFYHCSFTFDTHKDIS
jgi:hypothetical protein